MNIASPAVLALCATWTMPAAARAVEPEATSLAARAREVLATHCYRCHGKDGANEGGFNYVLDRSRLVQRKKIVPGAPDRSKLYRRLTSPDDPMPPEDEKSRPGPDEVAVIKRWIEAGAPDAVAATAERPFLAPAAVAEAVSLDLRRANERDRRFLRYFTLTHLYNAGLSEDELQSYRHGLAKLVNSLSWGGRVVVPRPIDPARTVFRIDLRDYQWNEKVWEAVLAANPYGVLPPREAAGYSAEATGCRLPWVRADWFVAAAARPPLYHEILQLPAAEAELERMLRVDPAENIRQERVARAGFNGSGVSRNNRLIERHESGSVVYWKSYDFASNTGRQNLFAHPLGPGGDGSFRHDGGEIIFSLPNGLQGYFLADGRGRRLDKGPTAIVSDPGRPDRAVENGLSCMLCHARGLIEKGDQVRAHVLRNPAAFARADVETVLALYPPAEKFTALVRQDARRFQEAVARTGAPLSATEPIAALARRFEAELDLPLTAAEAGVPPADLLQALDRSPALAQVLGSLKVEGGTVQRPVFVDAFADLAAELKAGEFLPPRRAALARLLRRADALLQKGDRDAALRAYAQAVESAPDDPLPLIGRGDAYRLQGDHDRAVADYTRSLELDPNSDLARNNRGLAYHGRRDYERALADFTAVLRRNPLFAAAYHNRAAVRHARGDLDGALADYTAALRLDPRSALGLNNRGYVHLDRRDHDRAVADFTAAIRLDPHFAAAFNNRGLAHSRKGEYDRAIADFTAAIRLDPRFAKAYYNRAVAHDRKGDRARADADHDKAVRLDPRLDDD
jgi:tetratricopeptide (TPR) repeat protein